MLIGLLLPALQGSRESARKVNGASNIRQSTVGFTTYKLDHGTLPQREPVSQFHQFLPHALSTPTGTPSIVGPVMQYFSGPESFFCPSNFQSRSPETHWPNPGGIHSATYQYPFRLEETRWSIPKPSYREMNATDWVAADYLATSGVGGLPTHRTIYHHPRSGDGSPVGMNIGMGEGSTAWRSGQAGWITWSAPLTAGPWGPWFYADTP